MTAKHLCAEEAQATAAERQCAKFREKEAQARATKCQCPEL